MLYESFNTDHKLQVLIDVRASLLNQIHQAEQDTNKITIAACTFLIIIPGYIITQNTDLIKNILSCCVVTIFETLITVVAVYFLERKRGHIRWLCRSVVRTQQAMGLFKSNLFISFENKKEEDQQPFDYSTILPEEALGWGSSEWLQFTRPYVFAVILTCIAVSIFIWVVSFNLT